MTNSRKRVAMIVALSAVLAGAGAPDRPARADGAAPFGPAILGATLVVFANGKAPALPRSAVPTRTVADPHAPDAAGRPRKALPASPRQIDVNIGR